MARTSEMRLIELMVLKEDIAAVLEFIGKRGTFQFLGNSASYSIIANANNYTIIIRCFIRRFIDFSNCVR